jgi:DNA-binding response OmpR family regulator
VPEEVAAALRGKRVALIGFTDESADRMCTILADAQARPRWFELSESPESPAILECDMVIVHVRPGALNSSWMDGILALPARIRLVMAGARRDLLRLPAGLLARDIELLAQPWDTEEVLMRCRVALSRRTESSAAGPNEAVSPLPAIPRPEPVPPAPAATKVVLADDDAIVLTVVGSTLRNHGMTCQPAANGMDALRLIRETRPHVAVLDVNMPGQDGFEVLAAVRAEKLPVAVILLTARQREDDILGGFELGAEDYLVKPFNPLELMARIKRLLRV